MHESVEAPLLTDDRGRGRSGGFLFESLMHPFVASVLRWPARLNELGEDTQPNPPDRQPTQSSDGGCCEGSAVVGANDSRQAELLKQPREGWLGPFMARGIQTFASEQISTEAIRHRQGVAVDSIAGLELALEVGAPDVVRSAHRGFRLAWMPGLPARTSLLNQPVSLQ